MTLLWSWSIILYAYCSTQSNNIMRLWQLVLMAIILYYRPDSAAQIQFLFNFSLICAFRWDKHWLTSLLWCVFALRYIRVVFCIPMNSTSSCPCCLLFTELLPCGSNFWGVRTSKYAHLLNIYPTDLSEIFVIHFTIAVCKLTDAFIFSSYLDLP